MKRLLVLLLLIIGITTSCKNSENSERIDTIKQYVYKVEFSRGYKVKKVKVKRVYVSTQYWLYTKEFNVNNIDNAEFKSNHISGVIYVSKAKRDNKFGSTARNKMRIFTFSDSDELFEYIGPDYNEIISAAFPDNYFYEY
jgi:hypothetical protein